MSVVSLEKVLAALESGARPAGGVSANSGEIASLGGEHLDGDGGFDFTNIKRVPRSFFESMRGGRIAPRDILVVKDGATTGKTSFVREDFPYREAAVNEHVFCARVDQEKAFPEYVFHFLRSPFGQKAIMLDFRGATVGGISREFASKTRLPLPSLPEQRRIAMILDRADALRGRRRAALAQVDTLTQSIFLEMLGDPRSNERGWKKVPLGSLISDLRGGASLEPTDFVESGFPILHKGAIKANGEIGLDARKKTFATSEYAEANRRSMADREFLAVTLRDLVPTGPNIGLVVDLRKGPYDRYLLAQGAYAFRINLDKTVPEYFVYLSNMPNFRNVLRQNAVGSTQIHIRTPIYLAIQIALPPVELQRGFARRISAAENLKVAHRASLAETDVLFDSLQSRAFNGQL